MIWKVEPKGKRFVLICNGRIYAAASHPAGLETLKARMDELTISRKLIDALYAYGPADARTMAIEDQLRQFKAKETCSGT